MRGEEMKILLIQPEYKGSTSWAGPPLGLGYLASALKEDGQEVSLVDLNLTSLPDPKQFDLIGITLMTKALPQVKRLVELIKPVPVVIGGPQVTVAPEFTLDYTGADYAIVGEGERALINLVHNLNESSYWFAPQIKNLDDIKFPDWDLISPLKYKINPIATPVKGTPIAPIITTRGCPYECSFCGGPLVWGGTFRKRSAKNVVDEIELLRDRFGVKEIFVSDDNFTLLKSHAIAFCREMIDRKVNMPWACPNGVRIDTVDDELLGWMKRAGCHEIGFGIESGNQEILDKAHKRLNLGRVYEVVRLAKEYGFTTYGFFILGLPGETEATIRQTICFSKKLHLDRAYFSILSPYPGTEIFKEYFNNNVDWEKIDFSTGQFAINPTLDLVYWQRRALREFYLRPRVFLSVVGTLIKRWLRH